MTPESTVGLVGMVMFSFILIHCIAQIYKFKVISDVHICRQDFNGNRMYENTKLRFHVVFSLNALFECVSALSQFFNAGYSRWGYISHLLGLYMNLVAFIMVIFMWNHVLASHNLIQVNGKFYMTFLGVNFVSTLLEVAIFAYYGDVEEYSTIQIIAGFAANILYVISLFVTTLLLLVLAHNMKNKLKPHDSSSRSSSQTNRLSDRQNSQSIQSLLRKINMCLIIFLCSYSLRIYFIGRFTVTWMLTGEEPLFTQYSDFMWALMTYWIPTLAPGVISLYIMRYRPRDPAGDKMKESLTTSTAPSSEQVYNYDLEDNFSPPPSGGGVGGEREETSGQHQQEQEQQQQQQQQQQQHAQQHQESEGMKRVCHSRQDDSDRSRDKRGGEGSFSGSPEESEEQEEDTYADRMTFFSKDGNDLKMSNIVFIQ